MLIPVVGGADRAGGCAGRLHDGQVLRRHLPRPAARAAPGAGARRRRAGARRHGLAGRSAACCSACCRSQFIQLIDPVTRQLVRPGLGAQRWRRRLAAGARSPRARQLRPGDLPARRRSQLRAGLRCWCARSTTGALRRAPPWDCGFPLADGAHAGHRRGLRPTDPPDLRAVLPHAARAAIAVRRRSRATGSSVEDHFWHWLYLPIVDAGRRASRVWSACCSKAASRCTCCTASSR